MATPLKIKMVKKRTLIGLHTQIAEGKREDDKFKVLQSLHDSSIWIEFPEGFYNVTLFSIMDVVVSFRTKNKQDMPT